MEAREKERVPRVRCEEVVRSRHEEGCSTGEKKPCQARSRTDLPCPHPAAVEVRGVTLCKRCVREQEAYFEIGELTRAWETRDLREQREDPRGFHHEDPLGGRPGGALRELLRKIVGTRERGREERENDAPLSEIGSGFGGPAPVRRNVIGKLARREL